MADQILSRLAVSFAGEGSGVAELTWGQGLIWRAVKAQDAPIWLTGFDELPEGTEVEDVADLLRYLMSRHQSLRTRFLVDETGRARQQLAASGEAWLEIVDVADDADPRQVTQALKAEFGTAEIDYPTGWPVRMAVVRHRGVPLYRVTAMYHLATDAFGVLALMQDLETRDPVTGEPPGPVTAMQPLEQAQYQQSPAGQRQHRACQQHWERQLSAIPLRGPVMPGAAMRAIPVSRDPRQPRYWQANLSSPATFLAMHSVAERTGAGTSAVLLAACSVALARVTGDNPAVIRVVVSNRFRPRLADSVSLIMQNTIAVVDVAGVTFDEVVRRAARAALSAHRYSYYDTFAIGELIEARGAERGEEYDLRKGFNDRRMGNRELARSLPLPEDLRAALPHTNLYWSNKSDTETDAFHIHIIDAPGAQRIADVMDARADAVNLYVETDTHYMAPADTEEVLRQVEAVTVAAAFSPDAATGI